MGIFNGNSIYNDGAGGGSLKNVGTLTDADFIHVDNNTISDYTNETRSDIYFYFDKKDYPLNSVISVNTDVNATVHVYTYDGFLFVPLGLIGSNSIVGGNDYNVIVTGDSFTIEEVTSGYEEFIEVAGERLGVVKIGSLLWTNKDLQVDLPYGKFGPIGKPNSQTVYPGYFYKFSNNNIISEWNNLLKSGWRLPKSSDYTNLQSAINNDFDKILKTGSNTTGFSLTLNGSYNFNNGVSLQGYTSDHFAFVNDYYMERVSYDSGSSSFNYTSQSLSTNNGYNMRFCKDA